MGVQVFTIFLAVNTASAGQTYELASQAGKACGGQWSVDLLETDRGWYITDMAEAVKSYGYDKEKFDNA